MIDTHTADGIKVAREQREPAMPMIVLETAQAVKFAETIREALGRDPSRPEGFDGIENLPQRVEVVDAAVDQVKAIIVARNCQRGLPGVGAAIPQRVGGVVPVRLRAWTSQGIARGR
jgi:hypothetical protein